MKNLLASWFRNLVALENAPVEQSFSIIDPTAASADPKGLSTVILSVNPSGDGAPTIVSIRFADSGVKIFEKKYDSDGDAQEDMTALTKDLEELSTFSKENKVDEAKQLATSLFDKYKMSSGPVINEEPSLTMTQASLEPKEYKGFAISNLEDGRWQGAMNELAYRAPSLEELKAKIDKEVRRAYGKQLKRTAGVTMQNLFFDSVDEAMDFQKRTQEIQGPSNSGEGKPLWDQMGNENPLPSNDTPGEDNELAPSSLSFDKIEKDKAKEDKDIGKRIKDQVKTEVESALEQKSASVFGADQEELAKALRKNGRNWDEIKKIFVKDLSYNEDDTAVFLDSVRVKEEGGKHEELPGVPKPPENLVSPETHDKLVKEIDDKSKTEHKPEIKPELKPEHDLEPKPEHKPLPLDNEIARADNDEIRKVATNKVALNPLQEPPAIGQDTGTTPINPAQEEPTMDAPPAAPPAEPPVEPEILEEPKEGDRVYVMGDYDKPDDGFEGTMGSQFTSRGDQYAVVYTDSGESQEVPMHRVVKASQKKVAKAYYEKKASKECPYCGSSWYQEESNWCPTCIRHPNTKQSSLNKSATSNEDVIRMFLEDSFPKNKMPSWGTANLKITQYPGGWALVNYQTPILYRANNEGTIYFNTHKYSVTTSKIQNQIRSMFAGQPVKETDGSGIFAAIDQSTSTGPEVKPEGAPEGTSEDLQSLHESALKLKAELSKKADIYDDSAFEANGWCRVWVQELEITSHPKYAEILKMPDENARIKALQDLAKEIAAETLHTKTSADGDIAQMWFEGLQSSRHDRINWARLANPQPEEVESSQNPKVEKKADETLPATPPTKNKKPSLKDKDIDPYKFHSDLEWEEGDPCKLCKSPIDENCVCTNPKCEFGELRMGQSYAATKPEGSEPDEIDLIMSYESGELDDAGILKLFSLLIKNGHAWSLQGHYGRTAKALIDAGYINQNGTIIKDVVDTTVEPEQKLLSKQYAYNVLTKTADDPSVPVPEVPKKEIPTTFKQLKISPKDVDKEKAQPSTPEQSELIQSMQASMNNLNEIKSMVDQAKAKFAEEVKAIESRGGRFQLEAELKQKIERLSALVEATQNKLVSHGDMLLYLKQETKEVPFKPTPAWSLEKVLQKFEGAKEYLEKAIQGAQSLASTEEIKELIYFPDKNKKLSKLHRNASFLDALDSVYNDVMEALKLIIGSDNLEEQPAQG